MLEIILSFFIGIAIGFCGNWLLVYNMPPKNITTITTVDSKTTVNTEQRSQMSAYQVQWNGTFVDTKGIFSNVVISLKDITNSYYIFTTNTNYTISHTNKITN